MFRGTKEINQEMTSLWIGSECTTTPPSGYDVMDTSCGCHYKHCDVENWNNLSISEVGVQSDIHEGVDAI